MEQLLGYVEMFWPFIALALIFYFFLFRPTKKRDEERTKFLAALKIGDNVMTVGGIHGVIKLIRETYVLMEISEGVIIKVEKSAVSKRATQAEDDDEEVEYVEEIVEVEEDEDEDKTGKKK